ncbi:MAG TPA: S8 family serine peptidase [Gemmatimonadota bacterium]
MPEQTYFYREGRRLDLEKAPDVIGISFLSRTPAPPRTSALTEPKVGSTTLRRLAYLPPPRFAVYQIDLFERGGARELRARRDRTMDALRGSGAAVFVSHAYRTAAHAEAGVLVLTDQIVAEVPDLDRTRLRALLAARGLTLLRTLDTRRRIVLIGVTARAGENGLKAANRLVEEGVAAAAEPNFVRRLPHRRRTPRSPAAAPDDPLFERQWHLENRGRAGGTAGADARVLEAWAHTTGTRGVTLAIVDDGVDLGHEEFRGRGKQAPGWNFQDRNDDPSALPDHRHGTACAGIATALANNGRGICGVAPACRLLPVRTPDEWGDEVGYADAVVWAADHGADVISCSWGPPDGYWTEDALPLAMDAALERAATGPRRARDRGGLGRRERQRAGRPGRLRPGPAGRRGRGHRRPGREGRLQRLRKRDLALRARRRHLTRAPRPVDDRPLGRRGLQPRELHGRLQRHLRGGAAGGGRRGARPVGERRPRLARRPPHPRGDRGRGGRGGNVHGRARRGAPHRVRGGTERLLRPRPRQRRRRGPARPRASHGNQTMNDDETTDAERTGDEAPGTGLYFWRGGKKIPLRRVETGASAADGPGPGRAAGGRPPGVDVAYVREDGDASTQLVPTGQVVVQLAEGTESEAFEALLAELGGRVVRTLAYLPGGYVVEAVGGPPAALDLANALHEREFVVSAEPNWRRRTTHR